MDKFVDIVAETRLDPRFPLSRRELTGLSGLLLETLGFEDRTFSLTLVDDPGIARLNSEFLGCTGPTNILSFPADPDDPDGDPAFLGELVLSLDTLGRETDLYGQEPLAHLARLLTHGLLHLSGMDHGEEMFGLTDLAVDRVMLENADLEEAE